MSGELGGLAPLTILTGPNGAGKSTVIDALAIGGAHNRAEAVGRSVARRPAVPNGAAWLVRTTSRIDVNGRVVILSSTDPAQSAVEARGRVGATGPFYAIEAEIGGVWTATPPPTTTFAADNRYALANTARDVPKFGPTVLVEFLPSLADAYSQATSDLAVRNRIANGVEFALRDLVPDFHALEIYTSSNTPDLRIVRKAGPAIPIGMLGDGIHAYLHIAIPLDTIEQATFLVEEPETHQHPRSMVWIARAIARTIARGCQVVLTTHSLEFIDVLREAMADQLDKVAVFNLALREGVLHHARHAGADLEFAREKLGMELR